MHYFVGGILVIASTSSASNGNIDRGITHSTPKPKENGSRKGRAKLDVTIFLPLLSEHLFLTIYLCTRLLQQVNIGNGIFRNSVPLELF